jgi:sortase A
LTTAWACRGPKRFFLQGAGALAVLLAGPSVVPPADSAEPEKTRPARRDTGAGYEHLVEQVMRQQPDMRDWSEIRRRGFAASLRHDTGAPLAVLELPRIGVRVAVLPREDDASLDRAVSHVSGTAVPGASGNVGIAGHRDSYFRRLGNLATGDVLRLLTPAGVREYRVTRLSTVDPTEVGVLAQGGSDAVTLVTCFPFYYVGHAPKRFIVRAEAAAGGSPQARAGGADVARRAAR